MVVRRFAALFLLLALPATATPDAPSVVVQYWAIEARAVDEKGARAFEGVPRDIRKTLSKLDFNRFRLLSGTRRAVPQNASSSFRVTEAYALEVKALGVDDDGRVELDARVVLQTRGDDGATRRRTALQTRSWVKPGTHLTLAGLRLPDTAEEHDRHLVIVIAARPAATEN